MVALSDLVTAESIFWNGDTCRPSRNAYRVLGRQRVEGSTRTSGSARVDGRQRF
jgi:hypothetical protein